ncbi:ArsR/SmtB family transcription factor [Leifsonia xyli]|nr:metalloregulator ArsR/SmtB family transcription factor [Leifsonia xyli]
MATPERPRCKMPLISLGAITGKWDLAVATAPPTVPTIRKILAGDSFAAIAAVTQVPSEVRELESIAGARPWGLIIPGFLAWGTDPTRYWKVGPQFTLAVTLTPPARSLFPRPAPTATVADVLMQAATTIPIVATLTTMDFNISAAARRTVQIAAAANEARAAVAAAYRLPTPRSVWPPVVQTALRTLPMLAPMDLREYLRAHFGKHATQTLKLHRDWIADAQDHDLNPFTKTARRAQPGGAMIADTLNAVVPVFRALGEPNRARLVAALIERSGSASVGELQHAVGLPQSTASRHLRVLLDAGIVSATHLGTQRIYSLGIQESALSAVESLTTAVRSCQPSTTN